MNLSKNKIERGNQVTEHRVLTMSSIDRKYPPNVYEILDNKHALSLIPKCLHNKYMNIKERK
jgi:hypothetical protein